MLVTMKDIAFVIVGMATRNVRKRADTGGVRKKKLGELVTEGIHIKLVVI